MKSIRQRLVSQHLAIILVAVCLLEAALATVIWQYYFGSVEQTLLNRSAVSATTYDRYLTAYDIVDRARAIMEYQVDAEIARIEVLDLDGSVVRSSDGFPGSGPGYGAATVTTDVTAALAGRTGRWRGRDHTSGEQLMAVSQPLHQNGRVIGVLRYVTSTREVYRAAGQVLIGAILIGLAVIIVALIVSRVLARSIIDPVTEVTAVAEQLAHGRRDVRATKRSDDELGRLADTLNYLANELTQSEQAKNEFLSSISHELRTPLTAIKGWGETLLAGDLAPDDAQSGLGVICGETDRLIALVEELLDFSRLEGGQISIQPQRLDLEPLCEAVRQEFALRADGQQVQLSVDVTTGVQAVRGDPRRLKQVLVNLVDNALKFTRAGGTITIAVAPIAGGARLAVCDTGEGIPPELLPRVTERFFKADPKRPGSGIGLSIVSEIVHLHGGHLSIASEPGKGTTVNIDLPAWQS